MLKGEKFKHFLNFIQRSLDYNPKERMTAKHALQHPFLRYDIQADGKYSWIKRLFGFG
jgi:serine/threonine protein kinase